MIVNHADYEQIHDAYVVYDHYPFARPESLYSGPRG